MNTTQLTEALISDAAARKLFVGVFPCDSLPQKVKFPCALVANTDVSTGPGEHWVCFYFDEEGNAEFFDSYGLPPTNCDLFSFFSRNGQNHRCNSTQLQGMTSTVCGHYCIAFLVNRCRGRSMSDIVDKFAGIPGKHDAAVGEMVRDAFEIENVNTKYQDGGGIVNQCCCSRKQRRINKLRSACH